jgi:hypothetical protein
VLRIGVAVAIPSLKPEIEIACLAAPKATTAGPWRLRAWILHEYLLSPTYILSGEDGVEVDLGDVGNLSAIFSSIYPDQGWLSDLFNWFIRLAGLHRQWPWRENCDSNILQIAWSLSATLPCDKYYALCGVLGLKKLKCVSSHTESEAFQAVILALTQAGRLSWLYAIPPAIEPGAFPNQNVR